VKLNEICDEPGARKFRKRVGRGIGSGHGKTGGRGEKGQKARSGTSIQGFEGGQTPLHRRLPKRGFKGKPDHTKPQIINLGQIQAFVDAGKLPKNKELSVADIVAVHSVPSGRVKLLADGELKFPLRIRVHHASEGAIAKVSAAGGKVEIVALRELGAQSMIVKSALKQDSEGRLRVDVRLGVDRNEFANVDLGDFRIVIHPRNADFERKSFTLDTLKAADGFGRQRKVFRENFSGHTTNGKPSVALYLMYKNRLLHSEDLVTRRVALLSGAGRPAERSLDNSL
jgi:large subunit ribosomal protein L15